MPRFIVTTYVTATVRETWEIEAEDEEAVEESLWMGDGDHVRDEVVGNETDRSIASIERAPVTV